MPNNLTTEPSTGQSQHELDDFDNLKLVSALADSQQAVSRLPPFLRTLLVADGTVTRSLEAYFWEPIDVIQLEQQERQSSEPVPELELEANSRALFRRVELRGRRSGKLYSCAESIIKTTEIPLTWRDELLAGRLGIGTLISDSGMESYREIIGYDLDAAADTGSSAVVSRNYRIFLNRRPTILITESFPLAAYQPATDR